MKRQNPLVTPLGVVLTLFLFAMLGASLWFSGGKAFSPGKLSSKQRTAIRIQGYESHAMFEERCELCHAPLKATQAELCLDCHSNIQQQMISATGTHSLIQDPQRCARCHPDHQGRDFDPLQSSFALFDHSRARFELGGHQVDFDLAPIGCAACHAIETDFAASDSSCESCHANHDPDFIQQHLNQYSRRCSLCHDGADRMILLNHQTTRFPLTGRHSQVSCVECHTLDAAENSRGKGETGSGDSILIAYPAVSQEAVSDPFTNTPLECGACHSEPQAHQGFYSAACIDCHTTEGWIPATLQGRLFEHTQVTGFSLARHGYDYANQPMTCSGCHTGDSRQFDLQTCINCHSGDEKKIIFLQTHRDQFGDACLDCHDGADRMSNFDHAMYFPLDGRHAEVECAQCHQEKRYAGTPVECVQCHTEPAIHAGFFGLQCQYCHLAQGWAPAQLRMHRFPLDHGNQGEIACQVCHPGSYADLTCYGCHDHQPEPIAASHLMVNISAEELSNCVACHADGFIERSN